ncbi:response regulator [Sporomusa sphaeroides]
MKFTPNHGTIVLTVTKQEEADNISILKIEVSDNGIGISEEQQARLFTSFEQADGSISRKYGGTGLGLAISKKIVNLMDGSIRIESKLNEGAKFSLTIKVKNGTSQQQPILSKKIDKTSLRILAVDDSPETRDYFLHVMSAFGLACDVAANGQEALALIHARQEAPYNIIFVDWLMPGLNGIDLAKKIKQLTGPNTVVIMISVSDWSDIEKEATAAGISKFIAKPLFPSAIMNAINEIMGVAVKDQASQFQLQQHDFTAFSLLVAEDVDVNREILASLLEDTGIAIDFAVDGAEALDRFAKQPNAYSLILMDVHMPKMNGYETVRNIRSLPIARARQVPIIAMTADVFREDIEKCLEAGMNDHIGKPIDPGELITKLNKYLPLAEAPASARTYQPITFPERLPPDTSPDYTDLLPILDVRAGLDRLMNNKKLYFTLLKNFTGPEMVAEIISLIETNEPVKTAHTAHALKGAAANLGLTELGAIAAAIEIQAKNGINVTQLTSSLTTTMDATINLIHKLLEREGVR